MAKTSMKCLKGPCKRGGCVGSRNDVSPLGNVTLTHAVGNFGLSPCAHERYLQHRVDVGLSDIIQTSP
eukprot:2402584-Amphidinium_carterae.1